MIARVMGEADADAKFGILLTPENVESVIAADRKQLDALLTTPSPLLTEVEDVTDKRR